jgi:hypothetical protein
VVCAGKRVLGFYTLAVGAVAHPEAPGRVRRNMPDPVPAMVLGRLAVDKTVQGRASAQGSCGMPCCVLCRQRSCRHPGNPGPCHFGSGEAVLRGLRILPLRRCELVAEAESVALTT